jgi:hypothetical protein
LKGITFQIGSKIRGIFFLLKVTLMEDKYSCVCVQVPKDGEDGTPELGTEVAFRKLLISR